MKTFYQNLVTMMQILTDWALGPDQAPTTSQVLVFNTGMLNVQGKVQTINDLNQMLNTTGIAQDKQVLKTILCSIIITICKPVKSYAIATGNNTLKKQVITPYSELLKLAGPKLVNKSNALYNLINPLLSTIENAGYYISQSDLDSLQSAITAFSGAINTPKAAIGDRKSVNQTLVTLVREANAICHDVLDENIISFNSINPLYVQQYKIKRQVTPTGHMSTQLRLWVLNQSGQPVSTGEVYIIGTDSSASLDTNGYALVDNIPFGTHTFALTTPFGTNNYGPFDFKKGKSLTLHVQISTSSSAKPTVTVKEEDLVETTSTASAKVAVKK